MSRYKYTKLRNLGPVHGFIIHTPDNRKLKDVYPQFIVRELNRMAERINKLEEAGDAVAAIIGPPGSAHWADENQVDAAWNNWTKAKEAKP
jgi:predicted Rossmann-fold nucleotide-binding protein